MVVASSNFAAAASAVPSQESSQAQPCRFARVFDHIYIINLPDREDRRRDMLVELQRAHFPLPGGAETRLTFFPAIRKETAAGFPSVGSHGCYLSHLGVFKDALRQKYSRVLILEDDLNFSPLVRQHDALLAEIAQRQPWHFAFFGHILAATVESGGAPYLEVYAKPLVTCHFYALDQAVLAPLIDFFEAAMTRQPGDPAGGPMYNDAACNMFRERNPQYVTVVARPSLGHQRPSRSDILPKWFDRQPLFRQTAAFLRRMKCKLERPSQ